MSDDDDTADGGLDVVIGVGVTQDEAGVHVVRLRDAPPDEDHVESRRVIELGEMRPVVPDQARPANSEIVRLKPREDGPAWDVEVVVPRRALSGPPQVATAEYRANWSATFADDDVN